MFFGDDDRSSGSLPIEAEREETPFQRAVIECLLIVLRALVRVSTNFEFEVKDLLSFRDCCFFIGDGEVWEGSMSSSIFISGLISCFSSGCSAGPFS